MKSNAVVSSLRRPLRLPPLAPQAALLPKLLSSRLLAPPPELWHTSCNFADRDCRKDAKPRGFRGRPTWRTRPAGGGEKQEWRSTSSGRCAFSSGAEGNAGSTRPDRTGPGSPAARLVRAARTRLAAALRARPDVPALHVLRLRVARLGGRRNAVPGARAAGARTVPCRPPHPVCRGQEDRLAGPARVRPVGSSIHDGDRRLQAPTQNSS